MKNDWLCIQYNILEDSVLCRFGGAFHTSIDMQCGSFRAKSTNGCGITVTEFNVTCQS
jgi:hypothetical protein